MHGLPTAVDEVSGNTKVHRRLDGVHVQSIAEHDMHIHTIDSVHKMRRNDLFVLPTLSRTTGSTYR